MFNTWGVFKDVFCAGNDSVFQFLQDVMDEVMNLFPAKYIHIGGDECPKDSWKTCPKCQKRIKDLGLKDEEGLQSYFVQRIEKYINSKGKQIIGWDEILEGGIAPNATIMSWRGEKGGIEAAKQHHNVIMTPGDYVYFDHSQIHNDDSLTIGGYLPLQKVYSYEPVPKELSAEEGHYVLGAQANLWSEYMSNPRKWNTCSSRGSAHSPKYCGALKEPQLEGLYKTPAGAVQTLCPVAGQRLPGLYSPCR
jgi:hexosaminidase